MKTTKKQSRASRSAEPHGSVVCERIGRAETVGQLRRLLRGYPDSADFGFRNQPMQELYSVWQDGHLSVVFQ